MSTEFPKRELGQPAWEIATLFPNQGEWSEQEYLKLDTGRLVEFVDGTIEVLPVPTELHQLIAAFLFGQLASYVQQTNCGVALFAPLRVKVREGKFREPDVLFMLNEHRDQRTPRFWNGADLVMEVISDDEPNRDLVDKRLDYALAAISEYWIVDPRDLSISVLVLDVLQQAYEPHRWTSGQRACSKLLPDFCVDVGVVFDRPEASQ